MRLKNKVALITGGGTGIGKATALLFAREGASIVITGRRKTPLEETVSEIRNVHENAVFIVGDITKTDDAQKYGSQGLWGGPCRPCTRKRPDVVDLGRLKICHSELSKNGGFHYQYFFRCGE